MASRSSHHARTAVDGTSRGDVPPRTDDRAPAWTRRRLLAGGIGGAVGLAVAGFELIEHGVLPGKQALNELDGACSVSIPAETFAPGGPSRSGRFFPHARRQTVGYTIAYPPGHGPGDALPLVVLLHGYGGTHTSGLGDVSLSQALAGRRNGRTLTPMALVSVDGGGLYWNPHPGDNPMTMIVEELIPMRQRLGLGRHTESVRSASRWAAMARSCSPRSIGR